MKNIISKRDVKFFLLGLFAFFVIDSVVNWDESADNFNRGFNEAFNHGKVETGK